MNSYIELFEQIVVEMKRNASVGKQDVPERDLRLWCDFLKQIKPESDVFGSEIETPLPREPDSDASPDVPQFSDVREIMILAEANGYPVWRVRPRSKTATDIVVEDVLFPTEKIRTISSAKLETFFRNYIAEVNKQGSDANGVVIVSDLPIRSQDGEDVGKQVEFVPKS
jgi:hypothetical protein